MLHALEHGLCSCGMEIVVVHGLSTADADGIPSVCIKVHTS